MRILRPAPEAEVVAAFLRGELDSPRYRPRLLELLAEDEVEVSVLRAPNLEDAGERGYRERLLDRYRAWLRREGLFDGFPERVTWSLVALAPEEVLAIRYIKWDWWLRISGGTRRPVEAAARIRRGEVAGVTVEEHEPIAARLRAPEPQPPLIAVTSPDRSRLVLVEGHVRLTAYALYPEYLPAELEIYLGTADDVERWSEF
ncbi:MAG TPA: hypothetical protein VE596_13140 [Gaiellaceae bacterium]|nr:hypothetical protein [Gaiellaceae bacterium]